MMPIDKTHDAARRSWVESANTADTDFPIQNLPLGIFSLDGKDKRPGVAIGTSVLDLRALNGSSLMPQDLSGLLSSDSLDPLFSAGVDTIGRLRTVVGDLLSANCSDAALAAMPTAALVSMTEVQMHLPSSVRSYTDFYCGIFHAEEVGRIVGSDPLLPRNYLSMPIGYNGRASSVRVSGETIVRPLGQRLTDDRPEFGPTRRLDFELELGAFVAGLNALGEPISIGDASQRIAGYCLLNDWSSRDIQFWEMTPLGPFNGKGFSTTISPWMVTQQAMAPFRTKLMKRIAGRPEPLSYLLDRDDQETGALDFRLAAEFSTAAMREAGIPAVKIIGTNARHLYWTFAQMITQHDCGGVSLCPGDIIGSGTISGPSREMAGSLLELCTAGEAPLRLPGGDQRSWLEDGDEITFLGRCERAGFVAIGFGPCSGRVAPAPAF